MQRIDFNTLTLEDLSARKVCISVLSQPDIIASVDSPRKVMKVFSNIDKLKFPPSLKEEVKLLVVPISNEIKSWKHFHERYLHAECSDIIGALKHLCWTELGAIDYRKTAEIIISLQMLDIVNCYILACLYCLEDKIPILLNQLSEDRKRYFCGKDPLELEGHRLEFSWPDILKLESLDGTSSNPEQIFNWLEWLAITGNKAAMECFFQKFRYDQNDHYLIQMAFKIITMRFDEYDNRIIRESYYFPEEKIADVLCYLLSRMQPNVQMNFIKTYAFKVLFCFLDWPWRDLFLNVLTLVSDLLDADSYILLLESTLDKMKTDSHLLILFHELWLSGFKNYMNEIMEYESEFGSFLPIIFKMNNWETIKLIFRSLDASNKEKVLNSEFAYEAFFKSIAKGKRPWVELCIREANLSKEDKLILRATCVRYFNLQGSLGFRSFHLNPKDLEQKEDEWKKFLGFLNENQARAPSKEMSSEENPSNHEQLPMEF